MTWFQHAVFYELYPRAFADGNGDGWGDFGGILERLDYLEWLGVDCIWLTPIYPSPLRDDGYDISSFYGIHPQYGTIEEFRLVVDALHARGMKIIPDLVINHTSDQHPWFRMARQSKTSPLRDYFVWSEAPDRYSDSRIIFIDTEQSNWALDPISEQYYWHRFYSSQPDLNYDNPQVRQAMLDVMKYWLDLGVDGFRVDAVPYLFEREGTTCENLPETHDYLKQMRRFMDDHYPGRTLLGEANQWPRDLLPYFGDGDEFQMNFHFPLMPRLYMALAQADRTSIINILADTPGIPDGCQWGTFLRCHDELTLEMVNQEEREFMWDFYAPDARQRINLGIRRRLAPLMNNDRQKMLLLYSMLFTLPGTPVLYYGDQIGMGDNINLFDRNGLRTPMQWDDGLNAGFSNADPTALYAPVIDDPVYGYKQVNVAAQHADPDSLLNRVRHMIHTFKALPVLSNGDLNWLLDAPVSVLAFWRSSGTDTVLALHNLSSSTVQVPLGQQFAARQMTDLLTGETITTAEYLPLKAHEFRWLRPVGDR
ncbi:MAG: maltose alpha-D-glucosyltransferase [Anaerolineae bacterium]|nr:maltose alpha-D-glucosyltransferase [Anaerolineae bacterium]